MAYNVKVDCSILKILHLMPLNLLKSCQSYNKTDSLCLAGREKTKRLCTCSLRTPVSAPTHNRTLITCFFNWHSLAIWTRAANEWENTLSKPIRTYKLHMTNAMPACHIYRHTVCLAYCPFGYSLCVSVAGTCHSDKHMHTHSCMNTSIHSSVRKETKTIN